MIYQEYLQSPEWKAISTARREFAGRRCEVCNSSERLEVHHRTYDRVGDEDITDLITLCNNCHSAHHQNKNAVQVAQQMLDKIYGFLPHTKVGLFNQYTEAGMPYGNDQTGFERWIYEKYDC